MPETETKRLSWEEANHRYLMGQLRRIGRRLTGDDSYNESDYQWPEYLDTESALDRLVRSLGLSAPERDALLLCAAAEWDPEVAAFLREAQGGSSQPTWGLVLELFDDFSWERIRPDGALRYWRLLQVSDASTLRQAALRLDEHILHFLMGSRSLDVRLVSFISETKAAMPSLPSYETQIGQILEACRAVSDFRSFPVIQLEGADVWALEGIAKEASWRMGLELWKLPVNNLPDSLAERSALQRLWQRESLLRGAALLIEAPEAGASFDASHQCLSQWLESSAGCVMVTGSLPSSDRSESIVRIQLPKPSLGEQIGVVSELLGPAAQSLNGHLSILTHQFRLTPTRLHRACSDWLDRHPEYRETGEAPEADVLVDSLWDLFRGEARPRVDTLAERIETRRLWEDLVLPEKEMALLRSIERQVRFQARVFEEWGFSEKTNLGSGVSALFAGPSGTGKTMAAEIIARALNLDLYRIDLSSVVSKYIGDTEKNLKRIFDAADAGGCVLLFDESDALFGKRSEVKDSHDRYANIEVSYLLQRMEAYQGLAVLTTNQKDALDTAFLRRIGYVVDFPFPDSGLRERIWRTVFPAAAPLEALAWDRLARLSVSGGNIRNIAVQAAFAAAEQDRSIGMEHVKEATRHEYLKIQKSISEGELSRVF